MKKIALISSLIIVNRALANQLDIEELSSPTLELVTTIHDFCLEQHIGQDEKNIESIALDCVNTDLEISTYKTFKTYKELNSFISRGKRE